MQPLPIDPILPELCRELARAGSLVLEAPPGAGKTTRVPRALLDAGFAERGDILVLEPRRIAARMAARRVAEELGEQAGETIGYEMRFERAAGPRTRVRFMTEGLLSRRLLDDRELRGVGTVLLDEFHERHLDGDIALAMLRRLQLGARPDLRVVAMSATLDAAPIAAFLGDCPRVSVAGRCFDVAIEHLAESDDRPLESQVASAVRRLVGEGLDGDVLVFLPGAREIQRAMESCAAIAKQADLYVVALHGSLSPAEQDRAVRPADRRKVILSTNVAETSVTIDGVAAVIDSGLARIMVHAAWSGLPTLKVAKVSRASAVQRAGRAGRTREGRCLRLFTKGDYGARPEHDTAEVARADLAGTALELFASGVTDLRTFGWFEAPPAASVEAAETLLTRLGAIRESGSLTPTGKRMTRFPLHPRLARIVAEAERRGIAEDGCVIAALIGERDIMSSSQARARRDASHSSDVLALVEAYEEAAAARFAPDRVRWMGLDPSRVTAVERVQKQLARMVDRRMNEPPGTRTEREREQSIAILAGYPDRVGRLRRPSNATGRGAREIVFAAGGTAALAESSGVADVDLVVAVDVEERSDGAPGARASGMRGPRTLVRLASGIEADWLLDLFTDAIRDTTEPTWNAAAERVEVVRKLAYDGLVLEETRGSTGDPAAMARVLANAVRAKGWRTFANDEELDRWLSRVAFVRTACPEIALPAIDEAGIETALDRLCEGCRSFAELRERGLAAAIRATLSGEQSRALAELAPESMTLSGGRKVKLSYAGNAPRGASRLQDFFGMAQGPKVAKGRVAVVLELLAPNHRAVQVTTDLAGFWERHYPGIAKELRRKYPRHSWPDAPASAQPPEDKRARR